MCVCVCVCGEGDASCSSSDGLASAFSLGVNLKLKEWVRAVVTILQTVTTPSHLTYHIPSDQPKARGQSQVDDEMDLNLGAGHQKNWEK